MEKHHSQAVTLINPNTVYKVALTWPMHAERGLCQMQAGLGYGEEATPTLLVLRWGC